MLMCCCLNLPFVIVGAVMCGFPRVAFGPQRIMQSVHNNDLRSSLVFLQNRMLLLCGAKLAGSIVSVPNKIAWSAGIVLPAGGTLQHGSSLRGFFQSSSLSCFFQLGASLSSFLDCYVAIF